MNPVVEAGFYFMLGALLLSYVVFAISTFRRIPPIPITMCVRIKEGDDLVTQGLLKPGVYIFQYTVPAHRRYQGVAIEGFATSVSYASRKVEKDEVWGE